MGVGQGKDFKGCRKQRSYRIKKEKRMPILCSKRRDVEKPWAIFEGGDWEWRVLKNWQKDPEKEYARFHCAVSSPHTFGSYDIGDVYCKDILETVGVLLKSAHRDFLALYFSEDIMNDEDYLTRLLAKAGIELLED